MHHKYVIKLITFFAKSPWSEWHWVCLKQHLAFNYFSLDFVIYEKLTNRLLTRIWQVVWLRTKPPPPSLPSAKIMTGLLINKKYVFIKYKKSKFPLKPLNWTITRVCHILDCTSIIYKVVLETWVVVNNMATEQGR